MARKTESENAVANRSSASVKSLRTTIDKLDLQILKLVNERAGVAAEIGKVKTEHGAEIFSPAREEEVYQNILEHHKGPLDPATVRAIYREIMSGSRALQKVLKIAFLGPEYSFSHLAGVERFGQQVEFIGVGSIPAVFEEVNRSHVDFGVVPLENSADGGVTDTLDMFMRMPQLRIVAEVRMYIHHNLCANCEQQQIRRVYAKSQALSQCRNWLSKNVPYAQLIEVSSTAAAVKLAQQEPGAGAVVSRHAAVHFSVPILFNDIEDFPNTETRFAVVGTQETPRTGQDKTAIMFRVTHNPGALVTVLDIFKQAKVNLTWIESFPARQPKAAYMFFVDFEGHTDDPKVKRMITALEEHCEHLAVLGSFPSRQSADRRAVEKGDILLFRPHFAMFSKPEKVNVPFFNGLPSQRSSNMIIVLRAHSTDLEIDHVIDRIKELGFKAHLSKGELRTIIGVIGDESKLNAEPLLAIPGVEQVLPILKPFKLASREFNKRDTVVMVGKVKIGGGSLAMIAGPCAIESAAVLDDIAGKIKAAGANILRGGAFKPRTSPYSFQGLGEDGLRILQDIGRKHDLPTVTEVMDPRQIPVVEKYADMFQIGARNMQNFDLLKEIGQTNKPVLLKRGMSATVKDLLMSAEYVLAEGNPNVVLCERGVRSFEDSTRNMLDMSAVPNVKGQSHLPIIVDPSHATGRPDLIPSMAFASIAAGADGVHIEVHSCPEKALSDGPQALLPPKYAELMIKLRKLAEVMGKTLC